jgi:hypothetical protein
MSESNNIDILNIPRPKLKRESRASFADSPISPNKHKESQFLKNNNLLELDKILNNIHNISLSNNEQFNEPPTMTRRKKPNGTICNFDNPDKLKDDIKINDTTESNK